MNTHVAKNFMSGRVSVVSGIPVPIFPSSLPLRQGLMLYADSGNPGAVFVGNQGLTAWGSADGMPLRPLDRVTFLVDNCSGVYVTANVSGVNTVFWFAC